MNELPRHPAVGITDLWRAQGRNSAGEHARVGWRHSPTAMQCDRADAYENGNGERVKLIPTGCGPLADHNAMLDSELC